MPFSPSRLPQLPTSISSHPIFLILTFVYACDRMSSSDIPDGFSALCRNPAAVLVAQQPSRHISDFKSFPVHRAYWAIESCYAMGAYHCIRSLQLDAASALLVAEPEARLRCSACLDKAGAFGSIKMR